MGNLDGLNDAQRDAVLHNRGPSVTVAGAGSGKTRVLTLRIQHLMENIGIEPDRILALSFTKKAAGEIRNRLDDFTGSLSSAREVTCGTIHSVAYRILRDYWSSRDDHYDVIKNYEQKRMVKNILAAPSRDNPHGMNWDLDLKMALGRIGYWKNSLIMPDDLDITEPHGAQWRDFYIRYDQAKQQANLLDLDDMLVWTWQLLTTNAGVRKRWQHQWEYILTDEIQDTSLVQWEIIECLAQPEDNLFVVGDFDQSIFSWRGGKPEHLAAFASRHPQTQEYVLDTNYRSLPYIVDTGNRLINHNPRPQPKAVRATRRGAVTAPILWSPADEDDEAIHITQFVQSLHDEQDTHWADMACIYRTNAQSQAIEDALIRAKIPYRILGGQGFWGRKEVRDMLAYLRVLDDPYDVEAYQRALFNPSRYLGKVFLNNVLEYARHSGQDLLNATRNCPAKPYQQRAAREWVRIMVSVGGLTQPHEQITAIRKLTDYDKWFRANDTGNDDDIDRLGNLATMVQAARKFDNIPQLLAHVDLAEQQAKTDDGHADTLTLLTIHRAKGLEWPIVILPGLIQGVLPHRRALDGEALEEERRLAYVAVTRARDLLVLSHPQFHRDDAQEPSCFLTEMGWDDEAWKEAQ